MVTKTKNQEPRVSTTSAAALISFYEKAEIDPVPLLERVGITMQQIESATAKVPFEAVAKMFEYAAVELDDAHIGIHVSEIMDVREWGLHVFCAYCAENLRETLIVKQRLLPLVNDAYMIEVEEDGNVIEVSSVPIRPSFDNYGQFAEFVDSATMRLYRSLTDKNIAPIEVHFFHASHGDEAEYDRVFQCPVKFGQETSRILYSRETMELPVITMDSMLLKILLEHAENVLKETNQPASDFIGEIEKIILKNLPKGRANIKTVSGELGMSERTLARRVVHADARQ